MQRSLGNLGGCGTTAGRPFPCLPGRSPVLAARCTAACASTRDAVASRPGRVLDDAPTQAFLTWAKDVGITWKAMCPATLGGVRGLMASGPIRSGDVLITVPRATAITLPPRQRCPFPDFISAEYWDGAPWFVRLSLQLLHQRTLDAAGRMVPYLQQLPISSDAPLFWDEARLQQLQYHHLIQQVKEQRDEWDTLYTALQPALAAGRSVSKRDFYWAMSTVRSRTFSGPYVGSTLQDRAWLAGLVALLVGANTILGLADLQTSLSAAVAALVFNVLYELILSRSLKQYAICPLIDFINHRSGCKAEVSYDYFGDSYSVAAGEDYVSGQQVFVTYGDQSNDTLMQFYGFSEAENPNDVYVMTNLLKSLERCMAERPDRERLDILNKAGLLAALQLVSVRRNGVPAATLQALRYLLAPAADAAKGPDAFAAAGGDGQELKLAEVLCCSLQDELQLMGTTLAEDVALLARDGKRGGGKAPAADQDQDAPVRFRVEKKRVLAACVAALGGTA